ncbi:MAG: hypothetical protein V3G42_00865 [Oscillospiraceae bacterium]
MVELNITKTNCEENTIQIGTEHLFDVRLSGVASNILSILLAWLSDVEFSLNKLYEVCNEGQTRINKSLKELTDAGYITKEEVRKGGEYWKIIYHVYESPVKNHYHVRRYLTTNFQDTDFLGISLWSLDLLSLII